MGKIGFTEISATEVGPVEVGSTEVAPVQVGVAEIGPVQVGLAEINLLPDAPTVFLDDFGDFGGIAVGVVVNQDAHDILGAEFVLGG